jgi:type I restriction enzyme S subunit
MSNNLKTRAMKPESKRVLTPKLRFPEFRDEPEWNVEKLGAVASLITERAGSKKCVPMSITSGVGLVSQQDKFGRTIAGNQYENYLVLQRNDFAYNKSATKEFPQGFIAKYSGDEPAAVPNSIFTCFRAHKDGIVPDFLNYLFAGNLHGKWLRKYIEVSARAHGSLSIDDEILLSLPIPLPCGGSPRAEQQKIAECLTSIDELIAAHGQKLDTLKSHKKGLMQQLFPCEGETLPRLRFLEFRYAAEWDVKPLEQVASYENGKAHENNISEGGKYIVVNSKFISTEGEVRKYSNDAFCMADSGDILMVLSDVPNGRAIAKCYYVEADSLYTVNQRICRIKPNGVDGKFLLHALDRNPFLLAFDDGVKQTNLRKEDVLSCPICFPQLPEEQKKLGDWVSSAEELISSQTQKLESLKTHKRGLMQQLFPSQEEAL